MRRLLDGENISCCRLLGWSFLEGPDERPQDHCGRSFSRFGGAGLAGS
jgi:hypothetical protein